jgi:hypothetical protein
VNTKTEETRHAMYQHLEGVKRTLKKGFSPRAKMSDFESALEEHLEALRQEQIFSRAQLMNCRQANTDLQLRIHALEHAAHVNGQANLAAGDQLREAHALIGRQHGAIADMYVASRAVTVQPKPAECRHENLHNSCCTDCGRLVPKCSFINLCQAVKP